MQSECRKDQKPEYILPEFLVYDIWIKERKIIESIGLSEIVIKIHGNWKMKIVYILT